MEEKVLTDKNGWEYMDQVPESFTLARLEDFHVNKRLKIGKMFLIRWADKEYYQVCYVNKTLTASFLLPFINANRVFTKKDDSNERYFRKSTDQANH